MVRKADFFGRHVANGGIKLAHGIRLDGVNAAFFLRLAERSDQRAAVIRDTFKMPRIRKIYCAKICAETKQLGKRCDLCRKITADFLHNRQARRERA